MGYLRRYDHTRKEIDSTRAKPPRPNRYNCKSKCIWKELTIPEIGSPPFKAIFIRAPVIVDMDDTVTVLARLQDGTTVAARQNNVLVTAFHPELTREDRFHQYFIESATNHRVAQE